MTRKNAVLPGARFGGLVVLERISTGNARHPKFRVQCDCGSASYVVTSGSLYNRGKCKACCKMGQPQKYPSLGPAKNSRLYKIWIGMRRRCQPSADPRYASWGGRGIIVCAAWDQSFEVFRIWADAHGYRPGLSIDRIDVDGHYEPSNCEFVTRAENSRRCRAMYKVVRKDRHLTAVDGVALAMLHGVML